MRGTCSHAGGAGRDWKTEFWNRNGDTGEQRQWSDEQGRSLIRGGRSNPTAALDTAGTPPAVRRQACALGDPRRRRAPASAAAAPTRGASPPSSRGSAWRLRNRGGRGRRPIRRSRRETRADAAPASSSTAAMSTTVAIVRGASSIRVTRDGSAARARASARRSPSGGRPSVSDTLGWCPMRCACLSMIRWARRSPTGNKRQNSLMTSVSSRPIARE